MSTIVLIQEIATSISTYMKCKASLNGKLGSKVPVQIRTGERPLPVHT